MIEYSPGQELLGIRRWKIVGRSGVWFGHSTDEMPDVRAAPFVYTRLLWPLTHRPGLFLEGQGRMRKLMFDTFREGRFSCFLREPTGGTAL